MSSTSPVTVTSWPLAGPIANPNELASNNTVIDFFIYVSFLVVLCLILRELDEDCAGANFHSAVCKEPVRKATFIMMRVANRLCIPVSLRSLQIGSDNGEARSKQSHRRTAARSGIVQVYGAGQYAMRLWVKPDQLAKLGITVPDIIAAVQKQNNVNPAGQMGGKPMDKRQNFTYTVRAQGRLSTPEEFGNIVIRANPDGSLVRVKDVARIELGAQTYNLESRLNGQPAAAIGLYQLPGSNAVQASDAVRAGLPPCAQRCREAQSWVRV
jgi:hypothetical protein